MCIAVIAVIQSKDRITIFIQKSARAQNIGRVDAALPSVQEHNQALRRFASLRGIKSLKPDIIDWVKNHFPGCIQHGIISPFAKLATGQESLGKGAPHIKGRNEDIIHKNWLPVSSGFAWHSCCRQKAGRVGLEDALTSNANVTPTLIDLAKNGAIRAKRRAVPFDHFPMGSCGGRSGMGKPHPIPKG
jgi:hypothetical protein